MTCCIQETDSLCFFSSSWEYLLLERLDINAVLDRVDIDRLLERSNIQGIISNSSKSHSISIFNAKVAFVVSHDIASASSMFTNVMDVMRAQFIRFDVAAQSVFRFATLKDRKWILPPNPGKLDENFKTCPRRAGDLAMQAKGRCAGLVTRAMAFALDFCFLTAVYIVWLFVLSEIWQVISSNQSYEVAKYGKFGLISFAVLCFVYESILTASAGRTFGKMIMGLLIVNKDGKPVKGGQAFLRSFLKVAPGLVMTSLVGLFRLDRRGLLDLSAGTAVIYVWDAEGFRAREDRMEEGERLQDLSSHDETIDDRTGDEYYLDDNKDHV